MRLLRLLGLLACAGLLLLGSRTLIVGPAEAAAAAVTAEEAAGQPAETPLCMMPVVRLLPVLEEDPAGHREPAIRLRERAAVDAVLPSVPAPVTDRNGHPLERAVYRRTVWQAFPPEQHPG